MDISMISFMLTSYFVWIVLYLVQSPSNKSAIESTRKVSNGLFTCGTIMSFFRLVYLCQITRFLGLLQLCLGKMIEVCLTIKDLNRGIKELSHHIRVSSYTLQFGSC